MSKPVLISRERNDNKEAKVYWDSYTKEYTVKFLLDGKHQDKADYYTNDREDAIATSRTIWDKHVVKHAKKKAAV